LSWISYISEQCKCEKDKRRSIIKMFGVGRRKLNQILHTTAAVATVVIFWWLILRLFRPSTTQSETIPQVGTCEKQTRIGFLKTHKCASSSVQNILMRFGLNHQLNFALPSAGNYVGRYMPFHRTMLSGTEWESAGLPYHIFALHTIWNREQVAATLQPGTSYITIVREPIDLFESLWSYAGMSAYYHMDLESFALAPKKGHLATRAYRNLGRNQMLWDAGLPVTAMDNATAVQAKIEEMEDTFDLVMVAERWDESMVLLRDLLCWEFRDVANFKLNARKESKKVVLSSEAREALREYLANDYLVYNHFKAKFEEKVNRFGLPRMSRELGQLKSANEEIQELCSVKATDNDSLKPGENKLWGRGVVAYTYNTTNSAECRLFGLSELNFIDELRKEQKQRALNTLQDLKEEGYDEDEDEEEEEYSEGGNEKEKRDEDYLDDDEEEEEDKHFVPLPNIAQAMPYRLDGMPDIPKLQEMFVHKIS